MRVSGSRYRERGREFCYLALREVFEQEKTHYYRTVSGAEMGFYHGVGSTVYIYIKILRSMKRFLTRVHLDIRVNSTSLKVRKLKKLERILQSRGCMDVFDDIAQLL